MILIVLSGANTHSSTKMSNQVRIAMTTFHPQAMVNLSNSKQEKGLKVVLVLLEFQNKMKTSPEIEQ